MIRSVTETVVHMFFFVSVSNKGAGRVRETDAG